MYLRVECYTASLFRDLHSQIWRDYGVDLREWNPEWLKFLRARLRHVYGDAPDFESDAAALMRVEGDAAMIVGLVVAASKPSRVFDANVISRWSATIRQWHEMPDDLGYYDREVLVTLGYEKLRRWH